MQTQKFLSNFRNKFSCNFEPQATKRTKRVATLKIIKKLNQKIIKGYESH